MKSTLNTYRHLPRAERPRFARTVVLVLAWFLVGYALLLGGLGREWAGWWEKYSEMEILKLIMKHGTPRQKAMWLSFASIGFGLIFAYLLTVMGVTWIVMDWLGF